MRGFERLTTAFQITLISLAVAAVYGLIFWLPFLYDDVGFILKNPFITGLWMSDSPPAYMSRQPLVTFLHRILFTWAGGVLFPFRLASLSFHLATVFFVLKYFQICLHNRALAFMGALIYALHPTHIETLAVASFQGHLISGLCVMAAVWIYATGRKNGILWIWALYVLALLSKEGALILPFLCALDAKRRGFSFSDIFRDQKLFATGLVLIGGFFFLERLANITEQTTQIYFGGSPLVNMLTMTNAFRWDWTYFVFPIDTCIEHSLPVLTSASDSRFWLSALFVLGLLGGCAVSYLRGGTAWFGILWAVLSLAPFMNWIPFLNFSIVANRYLYLAAVGMTIVFLPALYRLLPQKIFSPTFAVIVALCAVFDYRTLAAYSDPLEFWKSTARCAPQNPKAYANLGLAFAQEGLFDQALHAYQRAIGISPEFGEPYLELAKVLFSSGRTRQAVELAERLVGSLEEGHEALTKARMQLGYFYLASGKFEKARSLIGVLAARQPDNSEIQLLLGICHLMQKDWTMAERYLKRAALDPQRQSDAFSALGQLYAQLGDLTQAVIFFQKSLTSDPGREESIFNLARLYVAAGQKDEALQLLKSRIFKLEELLGDLRDSEDARARELTNLLELRLRKVQSEVGKLAPLPHADGRARALTP